MAITAVGPGEDYARSRTEKELNDLAVEGRTSDEHFMSSVQATHKARAGIANTGVMKTLRNLMPGWDFLKMLIPDRLTDIFSSVSFSHHFVYSPTIVVINQITCMQNLNQHVAFQQNCEGCQVNNGTYGANYMYCNASNSHTSDAQPSEAGGCASRPSEAGGCASQPSEAGGRGAQPSSCGEARNAASSGAFEDAPHGEGAPYGGRANQGMSGVAWEEMDAQEQRVCRAVVKMMDLNMLCKKCDFSLVHRICVERQLLELESCTDFRLFLQKMRVPDIPSVSTLQKGWHMVDNSLPFPDWKIKQQQCAGEKLRKVKLVEAFITFYEGEG